MKLSPLDIYNKEFKKATFGYNTDQVEAFLDEAGMAYEKLLKEYNSLKDEKDRIQKRLDSYEEMEDRLEKMLNTIQDTASEQTRQARKEAELIIEKAENRAEQIKRDAEIKAAQLNKELEHKLQQEYRSLQSLKENRDLFKIRFKTLLESHLQMLDESDGVESESQREYDYGIDYNLGEEEVAASKSDLDE